MNTLGRTLLLALACAVGQPGALSMPVRRAPAAAVKRTPATARVAAPPAADVVIIYRCEDANGMVSFLTNTQCPRGQRSTRQVMGRPQPPIVTAPVASATPPPVLAPTIVTAPAPASVPTTPRDLITLPPPALYRCTTPASTSYLSETDTPAERCRALNMVNADANTTRLAGIDPSQTCVTERDTCQRIPDQEVCAAWDQRLLEAKATVELGDPELSPKAMDTRTRVERVLRETTCAARQQPAAQNP